MVKYFELDEVCDRDARAALMKTFRGQGMNNRVVRKKLATIEMSVAHDKISYGNSQGLSLYDQLTSSRSEVISILVEEGHMAPSEAREEYALMLARVRPGKSESSQPRDEAYVLAVEATSDFVNLIEHRQSERGDIPGLRSYTSVKADQFGKTGLA